MKNFFQDVRYGVRVLVKTPGFTLVAVITLGLGIGANTAIFSVVNAVLLRPLPFPQPERLAMVNTTNLSRGSTNFGTSMPDFRAWRERNHAFDKMAAFSTRSFNISGTTEPERVPGAQVSADMFDLLAVPPARGRAFTAEDEIFGKHHVVIVSDALWQRRFGLETDLTDQTMTLNGERYTIVGVMPRSFQFPDPTIALWTPLAVADGDERNTRGNYWLSVIARLKPNIATQQAQAELDGVFRQLEQEDRLFGGFSAQVVPLHDATVGGVKTALLVLLAAVGLVLLIACANVANLLLARAAARQREIAIRTALGAGRGRLIWQLLTESLLLGLAGGALGLLLAVWGVALLVGLGPNVPRLAEIGFDPAVLAFTFGLALVTSVIFGLVPALQASKTDLNETLKESGRSSTGGARRRVLGNSLVVSEVAISFVLLIGAGLMINSLLHLQRVNPGFRTDHILTMQIALPPKYARDRPELTAGFFKQLNERVKALPGVEAAGLTTGLPLTNSGWGKIFTVEDRPAPKSLDEIPNVQYEQVSADYFGALGIPILRGRAFTERDTRDTAPAAVINETFARRFFADEDPIGKRLFLGPPEQLVPPDILAALPPGFRFLRFTIIGVIGDVRQSGLNQPVVTEIYTLHEQELASKFANPSNYMYLAVRTAGEPSSLVGAIRHEVQQLDPEQPIADVATMEELLATSLSQSRFSTLLLGVFAGVALLLAAVGLYGVISYSVEQRTHEIGIRVALGAQSGDVLKLVVRQGLTLTIAGVAIGLGASLLVTRVMTSLLYGVTATDPLTFAIIPLLLTGAALAASFIPARRATKVDPMVALRYE
jgi:putative ABC transport system permease protein